MSSSLMSQFPAAELDQVTLANWRVAPYSKWAFRSVRELIPSADIANAPANVRQLNERHTDLSSLKISDDEEAYPLTEFLAVTDTDAVAILHRGDIVFEHYAPGMSAFTPHILMSVSKSLTGIVAGILMHAGRLNPRETLVSLIPELKNSAYAEATVRHVLDMRVGLDFDEDYLATSGAIVEYRKSAGWNPLPVGAEPSDLRNFLANLQGRAGPDGAAFHYVSPNTDLLGWILERASRVRFADLMSEMLWQPMGAQASAYITVDRLNAPRCAGGICTTILDLARVGQLLVDGGRRSGAAIIPAEWIDDVFTCGDQQAWRDGDLASYFGDRQIHYRDQWYVLRDRGIAFGFGVYGQNLFVDPTNEIVIAKVSSQPAPLDKRLIGLTVAFAEAVVRSFT